MHTKQAQRPNILNGLHNEKNRMLYEAPLRIKLRNAYCELAESFEPTAYITLATNQVFSIQKMQKLVRDFYARFDRKFVGSNWAKKPAHLRTHGFE